MFDRTHIFLLQKTTSKMMDAEYRRLKIVSSPVGADKASPKFLCLWNCAVPPGEHVRPWFALRRTHRARFVIFLGACYDRAAGRVGPGPIARPLLGEGSVTNQGR